MCPIPPFCPTPTPDSSVDVTSSSSSRVQSFFGVSVSKENFTFRVPLCASTRQHVSVFPQREVLYSRAMILNLGSRDQVRGGAEQPFHRGRLGASENTDIYLTTHNGSDIRVVKWRLGSTATQQEKQGLPGMSLMVTQGPCAPSQLLMPGPVSKESRERIQRLLPDQAWLRDPK